MSLGSALRWAQGRGGCGLKAANFWVPTAASPMGRRREKQREEQEAAAAKLRERRKAAMAKAEAALAEAERDHDAYAAPIETDLVAVHKRADAEEARWRNLKARLEKAVRKVGG